MKKILLSLAFIAISISANAQNIVDRQTIKDNPSNLVQFVNEDVTILANNFSNFNPDFENELNQIFYNKYKMLTSELSEDEILDLTNLVKEQLQNLFNEDLYQDVSQNEAVFNRLTGIVYLAH